jgi:N-carbamoyl-L-amino-acid hydrolase
MNEEGSRFAPGMMGSEAFSGLRPLDAILAVRDPAGIAVRDALAFMANEFPALPCRPLGLPVFAYVEAHIEQAPLLDRARVPIGVVTGIQGKRTFRVTVEGEEAHAGTAPLAERKDALLAATAMVQQLHALCAATDDVVKFTIGRFTVSPNAPSVVPGKVSFSIDLRHPDTDMLTRLGDRFAGICEAARGPCAVTIEELVNVPSIAFPEAMRARIRNAATLLGHEALDLLSAAGHDARQLHELAPTGMIFVPCRDGVSHNEAECAEPADLAAGAQVLAAVLAELAAD